MNQQEIIERFRRTGALLEGHFQLTSGLHSTHYLQCARVLQYPREAAALGHLIAEHYRDARIETIAAPAIGGIIIGHETARALDARFIFTEREQGIMTLRRGFTIGEGERTLVVEDVITTGGSTRETINALNSRGAQTIAAASIIDRSNNQVDVGIPRIALATLDVPVFDPANCPACARGEAAVKPGSREEVMSDE